MSLSGKCLNTSPNSDDNDTVKDLAVNRVVLIHSLCVVWDPAVMMELCVARWLVMSALFYSMLLEFGSCDLLGYEHELVNVFLRGHADFSLSSPNPTELWAHKTSLQEEGSRKSLLRRDFSTRVLNFNEGGMRSGTDFGLQSGLEDVQITASRMKDFLLGPNLKISAERGLTKTQSRNSRALLQLSSTPSCPLDFQFMANFPFFDQQCRDYNPLESNTTCCTALLSALGQAESYYLRTTGKFRVQDNATVSACFTSLFAELYSLDNSFSNMIMPTCFPASNYTRYVSKPSNCQGIQTRADFERLVGLQEINSMLNSSCASNLNNQQVCGVCVSDITSVSNTLSAMSPNNSDCLFYTLFYSAGISSLAGPLDPSTAECILAVATVPNKSKNSENLALHIGIGAAVALVATLIASVVFVLWWKRRMAKHRRDFIGRTKKLLEPAMRPNMGLITYSFEEIKAATNGFSSKNCIGSGGFGDVYHGVLDDGLEVAIKRMKNCSKESDPEFINEVNTINSVRHRNLVILRGCCVASTDADGHQRLLVYDYMPNGSLQDCLFGKKNQKVALEWQDRRRISIGMAKGIVYLHNDAHIIHRDVKASNVLLDEKLNAKVADFGLAKFSIEGESHVSSPLGGTIGYVAPEYALYGQLTEMSDVYSFGVVLLELMSGRSAIDGVLGESTMITDWAWGKVKEGNPLDIVDERIRKSGPKDVMERFVLVGILCSHMQVAFRPTMEEALKFLEGDSSVPHIPNRPMPINRELPLDDAHAAPSPLPAPPLSYLHANMSAAVDALSDEEDSEALKQYREQMAANSEYSGQSAGVPTASLLR